MWVISLKALRQFWEDHPQAKAPLQKWYKIVKHAAWENFADVRATSSPVDQVTLLSGSTVYVFNVGGNKYRVIAAMHFNTQKVFILRVLTHAQYDSETWKDEL